MTVAAFTLLHAVTHVLSLSISGSYELSTTTDVSIVVDDNLASGGDGVVATFSTSGRLVD